MRELEWNDKEVLTAVAQAIDIATKEGAMAVAETMEKLVPVEDGELWSHIGIKKGKYGGWLAGVFGPSGAKWEDTIGGKAWFVEYGHAAPSKGKGSVGRKNTVKVAAPRPFMRTALRRNKRKILNSFAGKLK